MDNDELMKRILDYYDKLFLGKMEENDQNGDELVEDPPHYHGKTMKAIDVLEDFELNFNLGNALTYILRCNKKGCKDRDLRKAIWYLKREINSQEK